MIRLLFRSSTKPCKKEHTSGNIQPHLIIFKTKFFIFPASNWDKKIKIIIQRLKAQATRHNLCQLVSRQYNVYDNDETGQLNSAHLRQFVHAYILLLWLKLSFILKITHHLHFVCFVFLFANSIQLTIEHLLSGQPHKCYTAVLK